MTTPPKRTEGPSATGAPGAAGWDWVEGAETVDTAVVRALGDGLSLELSSERPNPYGQSGSRPVPRAKGRTLDDMRRLNEEMKRARATPGEDLRTRPNRTADGQPTRAVRLSLKMGELVADQRKPRITIGRGKHNDVVMEGDKISRRHARIELMKNTFVLTDESTNGTYVQSESGKESFIQCSSMPLEGAGMIGIGRRPRQGSSRTIGFKCESA